MKIARFDQNGKFIGHFTQPTVTDVHQDTALTNMSIAYRNSGYIAEQVFPKVKVVHQSDKFYTFAMGDWFRDEAKPLAAGDAPEEVGFKLSTDTYKTVDYAIGKKVPDKIRENADSVLSPDRTAVDLVTQKLLLKKEVRVANLCMTQANWSHFDDVNGGWASVAASTFVADIRQGITDIYEASGQIPTGLVIDFATYTQWIMDNERIRDQMKYVDKGSITTDILANFFNLEKVLIGSALKTVTIEKKSEATVALQKIWEVTAGKGAAFLYHAPAAPGLEIPSAGYIFQKSERQIMRSRAPERERSDFVDGFEEYDEKVTGAILGKLFQDTIKA